MEDETEEYRKTLSGLLKSALDKRPEWKEIQKGIILPNAKGMVYLVGGMVSRTLAQELYGIEQKGHDYDVICDELSSDIDLLQARESAKRKGTTIDERMKKKAESMDFGYVPCCELNYCGISKHRGFASQGRVPNLSHVSITFKPILLAISACFLSHVSRSHPSPAAVAMKRLS